MSAKKKPAVRRETLLDVSDDAKAVLGTIFVTGFQSFKLAYKLGQSQPSARLWAALCELCQAQAVVCTRTDEGNGLYKHLGIEFKCVVDTHAYHKFGEHGEGIIMAQPI